MLRSRRSTDETRYGARKIARRYGIVTVYVGVVDDDDDEVLQLWRGNWRLEG